MPLPRPTNLPSISSASWLARSAVATLVPATSLVTPSRRRQSSRASEHRALTRRNLSNTATPSSTTAGMATHSKNSSLPAANIKHAAVHHHLPERRHVPAPYVFFLARH
ncbi:hypothetical protein HII31_13067 [Pseudocercospora fuligena]|uniref:Uncharacterized protein n=1 Tax=Pseudocercospora fuligena TaxID=685502 RepID=A0A8H6VG06_9PEZI|nr:hypothetical protein HII31_13067 [Pseudocercospora fuligena]